MIVARAGALAIGAALVCGAGAAGAQSRADGEAAEPPVELTVEAGGRRIPVPAGEPVRLPREACGSEVVIREGDFRAFAHGGMRFRYPKDFRFEADLDNPQGTVWTLSGRDARVVISRIAAQAEAGKIRESIVAQLVEQYGQPNVKRSPARLRLGTLEAEGERLDVTLVGLKLRQEVYVVVRGPSAVLILLQDAPGEAWAPSAEYAGLMAAFGPSFEFR